MGRKVVQFGVVVVALSAMVAGCTNETEVLRRQVEQLRVELAQLRSASANSTVMMEDVQNKVLLLEDQMDSTRLALGRTPSSSGGGMGSMGSTGLPIVRVAPPGRDDYEAEDEDEGSWDGGTPAVVFNEINEDGHVTRGSSAPSKHEPSRRAEPKAKAVEKPAAKSFDSKPVEMYKHAYELLQKKQHAAAVAEFQSLIESYPNHDYADNALYWMGEAYYDTQDYNKSIECFDKLLTLYPEGNKVPDALLKTALCYQNLGDSGSAKQWAERLLATYPQTAAAAVAREKIRSDW